MLQPRKQDALKVHTLWIQSTRRIWYMHNAISSNQLAEWTHPAETVPSDKLEEINDYYNCMIDSERYRTDKRICKNLLS